MRIYEIILIVGLLIVTNGCRSSGSDPQVPTQDTVGQAGERAVFKAETPSISAGDADAIANFVDLPSRWNHSAAPFVRDYLDPNVSVDRWVKEASVYVAELRAVHVEMQSCIYAIQDPGIKKTFQEFAANYRVKLDCVTELHNAVARGDQEAELQAQNKLSEASAEGLRLAQTFLDRLRPYVDPQVLTEELRKRGKVIGELMKTK